MMKRPACPFCNSLNLRHFERKGTYKCDSCKASRFSNVVYREVLPHRTAAPKTKRHFAGSGQIADRITIPQYRYGSSRLG